MHLFIILSALAIMVASLAGAVFTFRVLGDWIAPRMRFLIAFASGVFLVIIYHLLEEALHDGFSYALALSFLLGCLLLVGVKRLLPNETHHHHGIHDDHDHSPLDARRMLVGDAVHNVHDGLILVPAFLVSPVVGFGTALGIFLHELVQEISEFFVLREAGYSVKKALVWNFIVSATILIGVGIALLLTEVGEVAHLLVSFSAGAFFYVVFFDLIPSVWRSAKKESRYTPYGLALFLGALAMFGALLFIPHEHGHGHNDEYPLPDGFGLALKTTTDVPVL